MVKLARLAFSGLLLSAVGVGGTAGASEPPPPLFGDWWYIMPDGWRDPATYTGTTQCNVADAFEPDGSMYLPVNQPGGGHGGPVYSEGAWMSDYARCLAKRLDDLGLPFGVMVRERNCPFPYDYQAGQPISPEMLPELLEAVPKLDFVLMDLERRNGDGGVNALINIEEVVRLVREHPNPRINKAMIGNYSDFPGEFDAADIWPWKRDRTDPDDGLGGVAHEEIYRSLLNVAMPAAYPNQTHSKHCDPRIQGANVAPNARAAIFWAPIERVSTAARALPEGHVLMPFLSNYVPYPNSPEHYYAPPPPIEDLYAMVQHLRMRGAHSYFLWTSNATGTSHPGVDYAAFRDLAANAWASLDGVFGGSGRVEFLNLQTDKVNGVQWSGVRSGDRVTILVSNLHGTKTHSVPLPLIKGLPERTPGVGPGEHAVFEYDVTAAARDFDGDGMFDPGDFVAFLGAMHTPRPGSETVGGKGAVPPDVNANGFLDLEDVVAVLQAASSGSFQGTTQPRANGAGASRNVGNPRKDLGGTVGGGSGGSGRVQ